MVVLVACSGACSGGTMKRPPGAGSTRTNAFSAPAAPSLRATPDMQMDASGIFSPTRFGALQEIRDRAHTVSALLILQPFHSRQAHKHDRF